MVKRICLKNCELYEIQDGNPKETRYMPIEFASLGEIYARLESIVWCFQKSVHEKGKEVLYNNARVLAKFFRQEMAKAMREGKLDSDDIQFLLDVKDKFLKFSNVVDAKCIIEQIYNPIEKNLSEENRKYISFKKHKESYETWEEDYLPFYSARRGENYKMIQKGAAEYLKNQIIERLVEKDTKSKSEIAAGVDKDYAISIDSLFRSRDQSSPKLRVKKGSQQVYILKTAQEEMLNVFKAKKRGPKLPQ